MFCIVGLKVKARRGVASIGSISVVFFTSTVTSLCKALNTEFYFELEQLYSSFCVSKLTTKLAYSSELNTFENWGFGLFLAIVAQESYPEEALAWFLQ